MARGLVVIDVGASTGAFTNRVATAPDTRLVLAIEPNEASAAKISPNPKTIVAVTAIADVELPEERNFWVPDNPELGSLLKWNDSLALERNWASRSDVGRPLACRTVAVTTLEAIMNEHGLDAVDFLKVDCQGMDVEVLASARSFLPAIKMGVIEVAIDASTTLYAGDGKDTLRDALNFLSTHGFEAYRVTPNDYMHNEYNLFFRQRMHDSAQTEKQLGLLDDGLFAPNVGLRQATRELRSAIVRRIWNR